MYLRAEVKIETGAMPTADRRAVMNPLVLQLP